MSDAEKPNLSADWDWSVYFNNINEPDNRATLTKAFEVLGDGNERLAIDLGCGDGVDTERLLAANFKVLAIDSSAEGLRRLVSRETLINRWNLKILESNFDSFVPLEATLINASYAIPFCPKEKFVSLWNKIEKSLEGGGVFAGHLFGDQDSWNGKVADMSFHTKDDVEGLVAGHKIHLLNERIYDGEDAAGRPKQWHIFEIVIAIN